MFFVVFFNRAGEFTKEEFEVAYRHFKDCGAPAIVTCFKQGEGYAPEQSVLDFMAHLDQALGRYYKIYTHIDSLKLSLLMQLKLMELDVPVEMADSRVTVAGQPVLTLENIPILANNRQLQQLKAEYTACEEAYLTAKAKAADPILDADFLAASEKRNKARKALQTLEKDLLAMALKAEEDGSRGRLTARQRRAYALMEQGDVEGADRVLDLEDILQEAAHNQDLLALGKQRLQQNVQELLQKVQVLTARIDDPARFSRIRRVYEEAVALEEQQNLPKKAMREYITYLRKQNDFHAAIPLAERYAKKYIQWDGTEAEIADAAKLLGTLYRRTNHFSEAEAEHLRANRIYEQLANQDPSTFLNNLADSFHCLAVLYFFTRERVKAEAAFLRAKEIHEQLVQQNPDASLSELALICHNLGRFYVTINSFQKAESELLQGQEILENLKNEESEDILRDLSGNLCGLGILYRETNRFQEAEDKFLRAKEIDEKLAARNPDAFLPNLAMSCNNLGALYYQTKRFPEAEAEHLRAKETYEKLAARNPRVYGVRLAGTLYNIALLYKRTDRPAQAKTLFLEAADLYEKAAVYAPQYKKDAEDARAQAAKLP